jgi:hypothetical protein
MDGQQGKMNIQYLDLISASYGETLAFSHSLFVRVDEEDGA